jgi:hypothetical protein
MTSRRLIRSPRRRGPASAAPPRSRPPSTFPRQQSRPPCGEPIEQPARAADNFDTQPSDNRLTPFGRQLSRFLPSLGKMQQEDRAYPGASRCGENRSLALAAAARAASDVATAALPTSVMKSRRLIRLPEPSTAPDTGQNIPHCARRDGVLEEVNGTSCNQLFCAAHFGSSFAIEMVGARRPTAGTLRKLT